MSTKIPKRAGHPESAPLSFGQQNLWFLHRLNPDSFAYNTYKAWRISGRLNEAGLRHAIDALVLRHDPLRTRIALIDGEPRQIVDAATPAAPLAGARGENTEYLRLRAALAQRAAFFEAGVARL